jgi:hypothetical protein
MASTKKIPKWATLSMCGNRLAAPFISLANKKVNATMLSKKTAW